MGLSLTPAAPSCAPAERARIPRPYGPRYWPRPDRLCREGVDEDLFRRLKKGVYGAKVRGLNSMENTCIELAQGHFAQFDYLEFPEVFDSIEKPDVEACLRAWVNEARCGLAVVRPKGEAK